MDIEIVKARCDVKSRKLKAGWTIEDDSYMSFPANKLTTIELDDIGYPHGINSIDVTFVRREEINQWVLSTFAGTDYLFAGQQKEFIWFRKEKHRTLLLIKWS